MDVIFDWNLGNMIYNGLITLRLCGFPFVEIRSLQVYSNLEENFLLNTCVLLRSENIVATPDPLLSLGLLRD